MSSDDETVVDPGHAHYNAASGSFDTSTLVNGVDTPNESPSLRKYGLNASLRHLHYSENKLSLDRLINLTIDVLYELINENKQRPIFYPTSVHNDDEHHSALVRSSETTKNLAKKRPDEALPELKVLNLNVQLGNHAANDITYLDKTSIATLLEKRLNKQISFLLNLKDRIDDTSSKVFVTGDLNAGKSSFCNALLRRKLLPEDQQPCTAVFCEVLDASINKNVEEVHAVPVGAAYELKDESSYQVFPLDKLHDLVYESSVYGILKIYVNDRRAPEQSLLRNGVIDIRLIDAPGLNMDSYQTTQVFSRQEEIDLIVFVVNSENHFTLSGKDFITTATAEKKYVFIVSNKFDNIKDKDRCKGKIMDQVKSLSPDTYKDSKDFVHFVSSSEILDGLPDGDDPGDDPEPANPDFDNLEASLRKFVLEKRAISKLLPAKNFLSNILKDLAVLVDLNEQVYNEEKSTKFQQLTSQVSPEYDLMLKKSVAINDKINRVIESTCSDAYDSTKIQLVASLDKLGDKPAVPYLGLQYAYDYAKATQKKLVDNILASVKECEEGSKDLTAQSVEDITKLGKTTLGDEFLSDMVFNSDLMFTRRKDLTAKQLSAGIEFGDFFDPSLESFALWLGVPSEFVARFISTLSYYDVTSIVTKLPSQAITLREQLPTQLTLHTLYSSTKILTAGAVARKLYSLTYYVTPAMLKKVGVPVLIGIGGFTAYYLINDIPNALPRKQARKIKKKVYDLEYIHANSDRVAKECRKVLNYPARQVMNNFQTSIDKRSVEKDKIEKLIKDADLSLDYFANLKKKIKYEEKLINQVNLENINTVD